MAVFGESTPKFVVRFSKPELEAFKKKRARLPKGCKEVQRKRGQKQVESAAFSRLNDFKVRCSTLIVLFLVAAFFSAVQPQDVKAPKSLANPGNFVQYGRPEPSSFEGL